ncbi:WecB/TagA/CpsF family glycosyltransferase [Aliivibrio fischeri]|uniref:WecB/TagA/CpsF family glycosyltransferase n=1 Tax=Aliivibrio fischeri TaxID=668 RepID=UPI0012D86DFC|nr:WecB/TagA/CpsF family glycosyltransferase [Aliivibrio fischeri]MUJ21749.1 teichoic acid biosynthesis protein A [Aliivibrio fischeri]
MLDNKVRNELHFKSLLKNNNGYETIAISFLNPFSYYKIDSDDRLKKEIDYFYIDGSSLVYMYNIFNTRKVDRVSFDFSSIADDVFNFALLNNLSVCLIGGTANESKKALVNLTAQYSKLNLFCIDGYSNHNEILNMVSPFDIIIFGMGCPLQDNLAVMAKSKYPNNKLIFTCGGFITQTSINTDYYHPIIKKLGLRWLQRFFLHSHVRKRVLVDYPKFFKKYILNKI